MGICVNVNARFLDRLMIICLFRASIVATSSVPDELADAVIAAAVKVPISISTSIEKKIEIK